MVSIVYAAQLISQNPKKKGNPQKAVGCSVTRYANKKQHEIGLLSPNKKFVFQFFYCIREMPSSGIR